MKIPKIKTKIKRQGLIVSIKELRLIADDLEKELFDKKNLNQKFQINIINKTDECDGWEIENEV